jgi:hypothetical protein
MKHLHRVTLLAAGVAMVLATAPGSGQAQSPVDLRLNVYTPGDFALLPEWCIDSQDGPFGSPEGSDYLNRSPRARQWVSLMGRDFWHMHHYCRALKGMTRLRSPGIPPQLRAGLLQSLLNEFAYVIGNCGPTMPLLPEVYVRQAEVFVMLGDLPAAKESFEKSRQLKPDYWPAYTLWIDELLKIRQSEAAKALAIEGLRQAPGNPQLLAKLRAIDPKAKPPAPAVRAEPAPADAAPAPAAQAPVAPAAAASMPSS